MSIEAPPVACVLSSGEHAGPSCRCTPKQEEPPGARALGATAMTLSTGALACGACCILPVMLPATVLASAGSVLSSLVHVHWGISVLSVLAVTGAWGWLAWQIRRTGRRPAPSTLAIMTVSTMLTAVSVMWPLIEKLLVPALRT